MRFGDIVKWTDEEDVITPEGGARFMVIGKNWSLASHYEIICLRKATDYTNDWRPGESAYPQRKEGLTVIDSWRHRP